MPCANLDRFYMLSQTNFNRRVATQKQVDAVRAAYETQTVTLDLLLEAQRLLADAESTYYDALSLYNLAIARSISAKVRCSSTAVSTWPKVPGPIRPTTTPASEPTSETLASSSTMASRGPMSSVAARLIRRWGPTWLDLQHRRNRSGPAQRRSSAAAGARCQQVHATIAAARHVHAGRSHGPQASCRYQHAGCAFAAASRQWTAVPLGQPRFRPIAAGRRRSFGTIQRQADVGANE